jgi:serine/threonine protein kinase
MKCIGEYEKLEEIGRGTYGSVYAGRHVKSKMQVAIKKLYGRHDQGEKEAEFLRQCADTNHILKVCL